MTLRELLRIEERRIIEATLLECGTVCIAAQQLGENRTHLHKRMARLGIKSPRAIRKQERGHVPIMRRYGPTERRVG